MTNFGNPTSITSLLKEERERRLQSMFAEARTLEIDRAQAIELLHGMCRSKAWWIMDFRSGPKKRPQQDIERAERQLAVLVQLEEMLRQREAANAAATGG